MNSQNEVEIGVGFSLILGCIVGRSILYLLDFKSGFHVTRFVEGWKGLIGCPSRDI